MSPTDLAAKPAVGLVPAVMVPVYTGRRPWTQAIVDAGDAELVSGRRWTLHSSGYAIADATYMHRLVLGLGRGDAEVDHINGDKLDNRRVNLRLADRFLNCQNAHRPHPFRGTHWHKGAGKWAAEGRSNGRNVHLGLFVDRYRAAAAAAAWRAENLPGSSEALPYTTEIMTVSAAHLRLVTWSRRTESGDAHAFQNRDGYVYRSVCEREHWNIARIPAAGGPACAECIEIIRRAAEHLAEVLAGLKTVDAAVASEVYTLPDGVDLVPPMSEGELREMWGK